MTDPAAARDHVPVPRLEGTLELPSAPFGADFGRLVHRAPRAVLRPRTPEDVAAIVRFARRCGFDVAVNGQGGRDDHRESHSLHGQALAGGIAVDAKSLGTIHEIGDGFADVDAGVRWSSLVTAAAATGQTAPVVNDFPYLSIGGTLSIGGMGATSHRYGSQADNVERLQVVTGRGELVACSRTEHRDLFDAVLAGAGQYGLIVRAVVRLVPAPAMVRMVRVAYADREPYLRDAVTVARTAGLVDDVNGAVVPLDGGGWGHVLILATYHRSAAGADSDPDRGVLAHLDPSATVQEQQEVPYLDWLFRLDALWDHLEQHGYWAQAKPRFTVFVPAAHAATLADAVLAELTPGDLGAGGVRLSPINAAAIRRPMFVLPDGTDAAFELSIGRFPAPDHPDVAGLLDQNRRFYDRAVALGAKRYLYGAIPDMGSEDWQRHYGERWPEIVDLKARFDPDRVLTPGQGIFG